MMFFRQVKLLRAGVLASLLCVFTSEGWAEFDHAQALYENHCQFCHEDKVHMRKDRLVTSLESLHSWVTSWNVHAGLNWNKEEITDVTNYLNQRFYRFTD